MCSGPRNPAPFPARATTRSGASGAIRRLGGAPQDLFVAAGIDEAATLGAVFRAVVQSALVSLLFLALGIGTCVIAGWLLLRRHAPEAMIGTFVPPTEAPAVVTRLRSVAQSGSTPDKPRGQSKLQGPD